MFYGPDNTVKVMSSRSVEPLRFFALPLGVIGRLCSVIVALLVHLQYYFVPEHA